MFEILLTKYVINKSKNNKEKLKNTKSKNSNIASYVMLRIVSFCLIVASMIIFYKCYKKKDSFHVGEFLAAILYPFFYLIYRGITYKEKCIPPTQYDNQ